MRCPSHQLQQQIHGRTSSIAIASMAIDINCGDRRASALSATSVAELASAALFSFQDDLPCATPAILVRVGRIRTGLFVLTMRWQFV